jgi:type I restriction enzyme R subunit
MMNSPEQQARQRIDELLCAAGWMVQSRDAINLGASRGVAVREYPLQTGFADYLLFVDRQAIGAVEAKAVGTTLSGVESQSAKYSVGLPPALPRWRKDQPLPFLYESTGVETYFTNGFDPEPRSRRVFAFHKPETLAKWAKEPESLRARLRQMPELVRGNLWDAQAEAILNLERSLAEDRPRALIQMATGSGKTFTAVSAIYRLIKYAKAKRVLFLVDRNNLGKQALGEFQQYVTPDDGRKFTELYNVQHLTSNVLDPVSMVVITTIQRLYSMLRGEAELDVADETRSLFEEEERGLLDLTPKEVRYNPAIPIEFFDFIVTDECHRSIYNLWRQVLDYFDATIIGLTATPSKQTLGFFNQNLVMEYDRARAVMDGVNVDGDVYRIRTAITEQGGNVEAGYYVDKRDKLTRERRWELLDETLDYGATQLDRDVVSEDQIRTVIRTFKERLFTEMFPGRQEVPKTLVFAKNDSHAEDIVRIVREEFGRGNEFCQKITYKVTGVSAEELIRSLRNAYYPRIAVTVDMIATGTDVKPLEILLFMRTVKSPTLFEQMLGRGTRVISPNDLQAVSGEEATQKDRFIIVDAVGVVEHPKVETQTLERQPFIPFARLLDNLAVGMVDDDALSSLASRLARLARSGKLTEQDEYTIGSTSGGKSLRELSHALLDAVDADRHWQVARDEAGGTEPTPEQVEEAARQLWEEAVRPFDNPQLRNTLKDIQARSEQTIDTVSRDVVREAGFSETDTERARTMVDSFRQYIEEHRDEIAALQILYNQPRGQQKLTFRQISELAEQLRQPPRLWTAQALWDAFARLERDRVRGAAGERVLTDLVSLVRHAVGVEEELAPYTDGVRERYEAWLQQQESMGRTFTPQQRQWLDRIAESIGVSLTLEPRDLDDVFSEEGGRIAARRVLGSEWIPLLDELNAALVA